MEEADIIKALHMMETDPAFITNAAYRSNTVKWPSNEISFVETHLEYLRLHPTVNPRYYLANLKLILRKNPSLTSH